MLAVLISSLGNQSHSFLSQHIHTPYSTGLILFLNSSRDAASSWPSPKECSSPPHSTSPPTGDIRQPACAGPRRPEAASPKTLTRSQQLCSRCLFTSFIRLMGCGCITPFHMPLMKLSGLCVCINVHSAGKQYVCVGRGGGQWKELLVTRLDLLPKINHSLVSPQITHQPWL